MAMKSKALAAAVALLPLVSVAAVAPPQCGSLTLAPSASFDSKVTGSFTQCWSFTLPTLSAVAASLTNVSVTFQTMTGGGINGFEAWLDNHQLSWSGSNAVVPPVTLTTQLLSGGLTLGAGGHTLTVKGTGISGSDASYGGNVVAVAIPEPETWALMLAGIGVVGFLVGRRRSD